MGAQSQTEVKDGPKPTRGLTETRYIFVLMAFLGTVIAIADRIALNVAIVGMVDRCKNHVMVDRMVGLFWFLTIKLLKSSKISLFSASDMGSSMEIGSECGNEKNENGSFSAEVVTNG